MRTEAQQLDDLRIELAEYVKFRGRMGTNITFQRALLGHQEMVRECYRDDPETFRERLSLLDRLCSEEGLLGNAQAYPGRERT